MRTCPHCGRPEEAVADASGHHWAHAKCIYPAPAGQRIVYRPTGAEVAALDARWTWNASAYDVERDVQTDIAPWARPVMEGEEDC